MSLAVALYGLAGAAASAAATPALLRFRQLVDPAGTRGTPGRAEPARTGGRAGRWYRWALGLTVLGGTVAALTAARSSGSRQLVEVGVALSLVLAAVVDVRVGRLPNAVVLPATGVALALLVVTDTVDPSAGSLASALGGYLALLGFLTAGALLLPRAIGMGDARYVALAALVLAYGDGRRVVAMLLLLAVLNLAQLGWLWRTGDPYRPIPLGPSACASCLLVLWLPALAPGTGS